MFRDVGWGTVSLRQRGVAERFYAADGNIECHVNLVLHFTVGIFVLSDAARLRLWQSHWRGG